MPAIMEFNIPSKIIFGNDSLFTKLASVIKKYGGRAVLITDGKSFSNTGIVEEIVEYLNLNFINVIVYSNVNGSSTSEAADIASNIAKFSRADVIIALGGFKVQNTAKAAAVVVTNSGEASDYVNGQPVYHEPMPVISIPTIFGSMSEISTGVCLFDKYDRVNKQSVSKKIYASDCIIDPKLYLTIPVKYVVSSAFSIFSSAFDIYISKSLTVVSETLISKTLKLSLKNLKSIANDTSNTEAISHLSTANMLCAVSACHSSLGAIRALSIAINSVCGINMSLVSTIMTPHLMEYFIPVVSDKYTSIARSMNISEEDLKDASPFEIAMQTVSFTKNFLQTINIPVRLREFNISRESFNMVTEIVLKCPGIDFLPRAINYDSIMTILEQAY